MKTNSIKEIFETSIILFFIFLISAPLLLCILSLDKDWSYTEKRMLISFPPPPVDLKSVLYFPKAFENYYNDHFGFRDFLVRRYHREMKKRFGESGIPEVITGKDGWYYFTGNSLIEDFRGLAPLNQQQLMDWREDHIRKCKWLAGKGIRYLFVLAPEKHRIYPEYLPGYIQKYRGKITRAGQLSEFLKKEPNAEFLDLSAGLISAKSEGQLYLKKDTHWNYHGASVGYRTIIEKISKWFPEQKFENKFILNKNSTQHNGGDLAVMLNLPDNEMWFELENRAYCAQPIKLNIQLENHFKIKATEPFMKGCKNSKLRAVVFRDSFFAFLEPHFSENFQEIIYVWQKYDQKIMERLTEYFHPDLVIEERVERTCF